MANNASFSLYQFVVLETGPNAGSFVLPLYSSDGDVSNSSGWSTTGIALFPFETQASGRLGLRGEFDLPSITVSATSGIPVSIELPSITLSASGNVEREGNASIELPLISLSARTGIRASNRLPLIEVTSSGKVGVVGSLERPLPPLTVSASGRSPIIGRAEVTLPVLTLEGDQTQRIRVSASISIPTITISAHGYTGVVADAVITIPLATIVATGSFAPSGQANVVLPLFVVESRTTGLVTIISQIEDEESDSFAISFNLVGKGISEYRNYKFNSFAKFKGKYLGANSTGLFELIGDDDAGTDIQSIIRSGVDSMDEFRLKRCWGIYLGYGGSGLFTKVLTSSVEQDAKAGPKNVTAVSTQKFAVSRRLRDTYWGFEIQNRGGSDFTIDNVQMIFEILGRRVA